MIERVGRVPVLLVASDFDGVLAPIVNDPDAATAIPRSVDALRRLARMEGTVVAVISGRRRRDLVDRFGDEFILVGEHGADTGAGNTSLSETLREARELVEAAHAKAPGSRTEHKDTSVVFHYREVQDPYPTLTDLRTKARQLEGIEVMEGKAIVELTASGRDKGDAVHDLAIGHGADATIFIGDDVTDERAFARLGPDDLGVKVGPGTTAATHRIDDPEAVADLLEELARFREG